MYIQIYIIIFYNASTHITAISMTDGIKFEFMVSLIIIFIKMYNKYLPKEQT